MAYKLSKSPSLLKQFLYFYSNLSLRHKTLLYLSPILMIVFVSINLEQLQPLNTQNHPNNKQTKTKYIKKYYSNNKMLEIISTLARKSKIKISKLEISNKKIHLISNSKIQNILNFIKQTSNKIKIQTFSISKNEPFFRLDIVFLNKHIFIKDNDINIGYKLLNTFDNKNIQYAPSAIFANWVFLDGAWRTIGDKYENYVIKKIYSKKIILFDKKTKTNTTKIIIKE